MSPWTGELEGGCEQVDAWRHCPTSRSEADVVEEVCGRTDPIHQKSVINRNVHHGHLLLHKQPRNAKSWRSDATHHLVWMGASHGWVPVDTHSTPVSSSEGRLWVARHSNTARNKMSPNSDIEDSKSTSGGTLLRFWKSLFQYVGCARKQTSVSHSSTESEIIPLDAGLRMDGVPALDLWDLIVAVLGNTKSE